MVVSHLLTSHGFSGSTLNLTYFGASFGVEDEKGLETSDAEMGEGIRLPIDALVLCRSELHIEIPDERRADLVS